MQDRLEIITGIPRSAQYITLQQTDARTGHGEGDGNESSRVIRILSHDDQTRTLEQCGVVEWMTIRVSSTFCCVCDEFTSLNQNADFLSVAHKVDSTDPNAKSLAGQFSDTRNVEKFNITKEEYEARPGLFIPSHPTIPVNYITDASANSIIRHGTILQAASQTRSILYPRIPLIPSRRFGHSSYSSPSRILQTWSSMSSRHLRRIIQKGSDTVHRRDGIWYESGAAVGH